MPTPRRFWIRVLAQRATPRALSSAMGAMCAICAMSVMSAVATIGLTACRGAAPPCPRLPAERPCPRAQRCPDCPTPPRASVSFHWPALKNLPSLMPGLEPPATLVPALAPARASQNALGRASYRTFDFEGDTLTVARPRSTGSPPVSSPPARASHGPALLLAIGQYIDVGRHDLALGRIGSWAAQVAVGQQARPDDAFLGALRGRLEDLTLELHWVAKTTMTRRFLFLSLYGYQLLCRLPRPAGSRENVQGWQDAHHEAAEQVIKEEVARLPRPPVPPPPRIKGTKPMFMTSCCSRGRPLGLLDADSIRRVIRRRFPEVRACYEQALLRSAGRRGEVRLQLMVDSWGRTVQSAVLSNGTGDPALGQCIAQRASLWLFPEVTDSRRFSVITYPLTFEQ